MEKVFAGTDSNKDKFDVSQLTSAAEGKLQNVASKFQEHDVDGMQYTPFIYTFIHQIECQRFFNSYEKKTCEFLCAVC